MTAKEFLIKENLSAFIYPETRYIETQELGFKLLSDLMEEYHKAKVNEITDEMIEKINVDPYTDSVDFDCGYEQGFEKGAKWFKEQLNVQQKAKERNRST